MHITQAYKTKTDKHKITRRSLLKWLIVAPIVWFVIGSLVSTGKFVLEDTPEVYHENPTVNHGGGYNAPPYHGSRTQ